MRFVDDKTNSPSWVFVFGSNQAGIHGAGAARYAEQHLGAKRGVGVGPTGGCYAIPTKDHQIQTRPLPDVARDIEDFIAYASRHSEQDFRVTRIGCGLAGFTDDQIAPLFKDAPPNCIMPEAWRPFLQ